MGTNFYFRGYTGDGMDPQFHIGKRSAAGMYCWDCKQTLCIGGESKVHTGSGAYDACSKCGKKPIKEDIGNSSAGRELGFNKNPPGRKEGVASCSSFTWATKEENVMEVLAKPPSCHCCGQALPDPDKVVEDEYGRTFTLEEFKEILEECPIRFFSIGEHFC